MIEVERITEPVAFHGEGPVWYQPWGGLRYVDMHAGDVHGVDLDTGQVSKIHIGELVAAIRPRARGGMVVGTARGFGLVDEDGAVHQLPELWEDASVRMNEGACDPDGRFYCGSMAYGMHAGAGRLHRLNRDRTVTVVLDGVGVSNGLAWSPDLTTAYYVDSLTLRVDAFDYESGELNRRRPVIKIEEGAGWPDGIAVDSEGGIWVALWGGGAVRRYRADGVLDHEVRLPVTQVTACTFGGADLDELYMTTSRETVPVGEQLEAGSVFRVRTGVHGLSVLPYQA